MGKPAQAELRALEVPPSLFWTPSAFSYSLRQSGRTPVLVLHLESLGHHPRLLYGGAELVGQEQGSFLTLRLGQERTPVSLEAGKCRAAEWFQRKAGREFWKFLSLKDRLQVGKGGNLGCLD